MSTPSALTNNIATTPPSRRAVIVDVNVPHIEALGCRIQRFAGERGWVEMACRPWQTLSPRDPSKVVAENMPYSGFVPVLPGTRAFFGRNGKFTGVLVYLPEGITVCDLMEIYDQALNDFQIAYRLVPSPVTGEPALLFLAPGETGEVVNELPDLSLPF